MLIVINDQELRIWEEMVVTLWQYHPNISLKGPRNTSVRIASSLAENRTGYVLKTSQ